MLQPNESAASLRWLTESLCLGDASSPCACLWQQVRTDMSALTQSVTSLQDWISDFWICKGAEATPIGIGTRWFPPERLDEWPSVPAGYLEKHRPEGLRATNHDAFARVLAAAAAAAEPGSHAAVMEFYALDRATTRRGDLPMIKAQHIRAWLASALGNLLMSAALSPQDRHDAIVAEVARRLLIPRELKAAPMWGLHFCEGELGILYNCRRHPSGSFSWHGIRIGQGEEWLKHWQWLSAPVAAADLIPALALAARLLRCRPLLDGLVAGIAGEERGIRELSLAVLRRWLLALKAMAWLEDALQRTWSEVRPQDLACFAFNAIKPDWPRRIVAISHRSADAKPALMACQAWRSSLFAIDANYAPSWESNTGMVWGLFAGTPLLVRMDSPRYEGSVWCRREAEMLRYLLEASDFLSGRFVLQAGVGDAGSLDRCVDAWRPIAEVSFGASEFPPLCNVYVTGGDPEWTLAMLRAAAALRIFHALYGTARIANGLAGVLARGDAEIPVPPPTNHPGGWAAYRAVFQSLQRECALPAGGPPALLLPADAQPWDADRTQAFADAIPDLQDGFPALADVLAAMEWRETLIPLLRDANLGDMVLVDLRGLTKQAWETEPALSMARGIAALRSPPRPLWFIQHAGQAVDEWGLADDRPIFTEYDERQFAWMLEGRLSPEWPASYAERCGLVMAPELLQRCRATGANP